MTIHVSPENEHFIEDAVKSGAYADTGQVLDEALNLLRQREDLRRDVNAGIDQLDKGETIPAAEVFHRLRQRVKNTSPPNSNAD